MKSEFRMMLPVYSALAGVAILAGIGLGKFASLARPNYKNWIYSDVQVREGKVFKRADEREIAIEGKDKLTLISITSFGPRRFEYYNGSWFPTPLFGESCELGVKLHLEEKNIRN